MKEVREGGEKAAKLVNGKMLKIGESRMSHIIFMTFLYYTFEISRIESCGGKQDQ